MKNTILSIIFAVAFISCGGTKTCDGVRLYEHSYTEFWHYENGTRYQVYKTSNGRYYIFVLHKDSKLVRKYIKVLQS
jgi:hypothetical protein